jgi:hypothetical protein
VDKMLKEMCCEEMKTFELNDDRSCSTSSSSTHLVVEEYASAEKVIRYLSKKYPASFKYVTKPCNDPQLNKYETSALIEYMDVTETTAYEKMNRFFRSIKSIDILAPKRELVSFQSDAPTPRLYTATVDCSSKNKKGEETVYGIQTAIHDEIRIRIQRHLANNPNLFDTDQPTDNSTPMFGYANPGNPSSILCMLGTDHGQAHTQFKLSIHLLPSQARREKKDKVHGILNIPFATIQCKKENSSILVLATPQINTAINMLENSKLMGVRKEGEIIHCFWVSNHATHL